MNTANCPCCGDKNTENSSVKENPCCCNRQPGDNTCCDTCCCEKCCDCENCTCKR